MTAVRRFGIAVAPIGAPVAGVGFLIWMALPAVAWVVRRRRLKD
jgi:hypothetical protein